MIPTDETMRQSGWVKLYHPAAVEVSIPLPLNRSISTEEARNLLSSVNTLIHAGFSVELPAHDESERVEEIGFVVRRLKVNPDGSETPLVDLYPVRGNYRHLGKYLNTEAEIKEFESACGIQLTAIPLYEGDNPIERGRNPKLDRFVVVLRQPARLVWKHNPRYEGETDKKNSKRLFVRWQV